jgi:pimeloyl-ACP methyl ester carboxylesterase
MIPGHVDELVQVPGGTIFTRRWNAARADSAPIILLHDSLGSVELWRQFPARLADIAQRTVIAYDRLGYGKSTSRVQPPGFAFIVEEAETFFPAITHALSVTGFLLFGHSVGGAMALVIAALRGDSCKGVITEAAQSFVEPRTLDGIRASKKAFEDSEQFARLSRRHGEKARWVLEAWTEVWLSPEFRAWSLDEYLPLVQCPVLAIHGDQDEYGSVEFARRIASNVGGKSELQILAGCGHVPHREREADVLDLTSSFIGRHAIP